MENTRIMIILGLLMFALWAVVLFIDSADQSKINKNHDEAARAEIGEPIAKYWSPETRFEIAGPVKKVTDLDLGWVIIRRVEDGNLFSAMVVPFHEIPLNSRVNIVEVRYMHHRAMQMDFMVVQ